MEADPKRKEIPKVLMKERRARVDRKGVAPEELGRCNGEEGRPTWVAVEGKVYDLSQSPLWKRGLHMNRHRSGQDLTVYLDAAPHGREVLSRGTVREVGHLLEGEEESIGPFWSRLFQIYPILRRHPHPMTIHFPIAYLIGGALFIFLDLILPSIAPFEEMAFAMLILAFLFTPPAIGTGWLTWQVNYAGRRVPQITRKIQLAVLLVLLEIACLLLRILGPGERTGLGWIYPALVFLLTANVLLLGHYGGQLTLPYKKE